MDDKTRKFWVACALLAFVFCFGGGLWILSKTGLDHGNDAVSTGIGLYFIGKAFFVGPLLMITALKSSR
ncbi:MAG: hypothetical protein KJ964_00170 [Verrucomicrobia bacterium]|nr:hypothetical protein [Verrucomicrobiota bacterium]MBU1736211.1 hypothetical protein [Verrucomicrobiota bacterium]MBU1856568.1 hypothetical protein [Verrucomicrobiota bacterium]